MKWGEKNGAKRGEKFHHASGYNGGNLYGYIGYD